jgi:hypothetical protein
VVTVAAVLDLVRFTGTIGGGSFIQGFGEFSSEVNYLLWVSFLAEFLGNC